MNLNRTRTANGARWGSLDFIQARAVAGRGACIGIEILRLIYYTLRQQISLALDALLLSVYTSIYLAINIYIYIYTICNMYIDPAKYRAEPSRALPCPANG